MSATLSIINNFSFTVDGLSFAGKQGLSTDGFLDPFVVALSGPGKYMPGTLATASIAVLFNSTNDLPTTFSYLYLWADQDVYVQLIGTATNAVIKVAAEQPFVLPGHGSVLAAAATTAITGGAEPAVTALTKVVVGNYSGSSASYLFALLS